jgi:outer membrane protein OmpA-like peptidoglycan-associated protein
MKYLVAHGVTIERLTAVGYGMERPIVDNNSESNRALNRRVQFVRSEQGREGCPKTGAQ